MGFWDLAWENHGVEGAPWGPIPGVLEQTGRGMAARPKRALRKARTVMATDAEWARIGEAAAEAGLSISEHVVRGSTGSGGPAAEPGLPVAVLRRVARAVLALEEMEGRRLELQGAGEDWRRPLERADAWIDGETGIG